MTRPQPRPRPQPLAGMHVVELAQFIAGPTAAQYLADFGAEVVKIEPRKGDGSRDLEGTQFGSAYFRAFNTTKQRRVLDIRTPEGLASLMAMLGKADALVCNMAPATLKRAGLDPEALVRENPRLIVTLVSGFGRHDARSCMDTIAQCESGFAWLNSDEDGRPRVSTSWPVDFFSGLHAGMATAMALMDRERTGGMIIDISMMEVAAAMLLGPAALLAGEGAKLQPGMGNRDRAAAPSNIYRCRDGYVYIYGGLDHYWEKLRPLVGGEQASHQQRLAQATEFDAQVEAWTSGLDRAEVLDRLALLAVPAGAVRHPNEAITLIRSATPDAVTTVLETGENVPVYPARFNGERLPRRPAPDAGTAMPRA